MEKDNFFLKNKKVKRKRKILNPKNWGIDFNKNEYQEIILSNSNHPEIIDKNK